MIALQDQTPLNGRGRVTMRTINVISYGRSGEQQGEKKGRKPNFSFKRKE